MKIEILGPGCLKCGLLEQNVKIAVEELKIKAEIVKVKDVNEIAKHGVVMTPALIVDGKLKSSGKVIGPQEIKKLLA